ncbi:MAG: hypothetical protein ACR652_18920 [Methylocystis sp.]|uniref:hypothetical protein n=1 Tax=Methylocystis sp. TaxID=1911079 RepID=UPI003DA46CBD
MSGHSTTSGKPFEPTAEDLELIERARRQIEKMATLPPVSAEFQKRVNSEMGVEDDTAAPARESGEK